ncbi:hypothetical protein TCON_1336 [Astathelohania contejeani]|uniref:Uncharacterized protein n=1 Tax=Astathelohania contejeani TaxID=164912 RepID=A0ABQ7HZ94_9MICR|nr:hypothetical protein TCON_1336 [Thelohania contejeani]
MKSCYLFFIIGLIDNTLLPDVKYLGLKTNKTNLKINLPDTNKQTIYPSIIPSKNKYVDEKNVYIIIESILDMIMNGILKSKIIFSDFNHLTKLNSRIIFDHRNIPLKNKQCLNNSFIPVHCINENKENHIYLNPVIKNQLLILFSKLSKDLKKIKCFIKILIQDQFFCTCTLFYLIAAYNAIHIVPKTLQHAFSMVIKDNIIIVNINYKNLELVDMPGYKIYYANMFSLESENYLDIYDKNDQILDPTKRKKILRIIVDALDNTEGLVFNIIAVNKYMNSQLTYFANGEIGFSSDLFDIVIKGNLIVISSKESSLKSDYILHFIMNDLKTAVEEIISKSDTIKSTKDIMVTIIYKNFPDKKKVNLFDPHVIKRIQ